MVPKSKYKTATEQPKSQPISKPIEEPEPITRLALFQPPPKKQPKRKATLNTSTGDRPNSAEPTSSLDSAFKPTLKETADSSSSPSPSTESKPNHPRPPEDTDSPWIISDFDRDSERGDASENEERLGIRAHNSSGDLTRSIEILSKSVERLAKSAEDLPDEDLTAKSFLTAPKAKKGTHRTAKKRQEFLEDPEAEDEGVRVAQSPKREEGDEQEEGKVPEAGHKEGTESKR